MLHPDNIDLLKCSECDWKADTLEDGELVTDDGTIVCLAHVGCPECGGMLILNDTPIVAFSLDTESGTR